MTSGLLEQIAPEVLPGALAQCASELDGRDPLDRGDLSRVEIFTMDYVRAGDRSLRAVSAWHGDMDLGGVHVADIPQIQCCVVREHSLCALGPQRRRHVGLHRSARHERDTVDASTHPFQLPSPSQLYERLWPIANLPCIVDRDEPEPVCRSLRQLTETPRRHPLTIPQNVYFQAPYLGPPLHRAFHALVSEESLVQPCVDAYRARYRELAASETIVFPGIREILTELSARLPLIIATSKPYALAEPLLDALDLRRFFVAVIGPELDSENEQKAITVGRALRELAPKARPVMVGDRKHDIAAANEHSIPAIGVLWGIGSEHELLTAGADALAETTPELAALLAPWP